MIWDAVVVKKKIVAVTRQQRVEACLPCLELELVTVMVMIHWCINLDVIAWKKRANGGTNITTRATSIQELTNADKQ